MRFKLISVWSYVLALVDPLLFCSVGKKSGKARIRKQRTLFFKKKIDMQNRLNWAQPIKPFTLIKVQEECNLNNLSKRCIWSEQLSDPFFNSFYGQIKEIKGWVSCIPFDCQSYRLFVSILLFIQGQSKDTWKKKPCLTLTFYLTVIERCWLDRMSFVDRKEILWVANLYFEQFTPASSCLPILLSRSICWL